MFSTLGCRSYCKFSDLSHFDLDHFEVKVIARLPLVEASVKLAPENVARTEQLRGANSEQKLNANSEVKLNTNREETGVVKTEFDLFVGQR